MKFRYVVYPGGVCRVYKMNDRFGEIVWSSFSTDPYIGLQERPPAVITRDGDFEDEADSLEQFIEKHIEKFL